LIVELSITYSLLRTPNENITINYMTLRIYCRVICRYHGMTHMIILCYHGMTSYYCCQYHGMTSYIYISISSHRRGIKWHRYSFRIALVNLRGI